MTWTASGYAWLGGLLLLLFAAVYFTERRRVSGKPMLDEYSYRSVRKMVSACLLGATAVAGAVYAWTGSAETAVSVGGMLAGVILIGSLRCFFAEYQRKRDGAKNLDE